MDLLQSYCEAVLEFWCTPLETFSLNVFAESHNYLFVFRSACRSVDAQYVAVSSQDGYCSLLAFSKDELGTRLSTSGSTLPLLNSNISPDF